MSNKIEKGSVVEIIDNRCFLIITKGNSKTPKTTYIFEIDIEDKEKVEKHRWHVSFFKSSFNKTKYPKVYFQKNKKECIILSRYLLNYHGKKFILQEDKDFFNYKKDNLKINKGFKKSRGDSNFRWNIETKQSKKNGKQSAIFIDGKLLAQELHHVVAKSIAKKLEIAFDKLKWDNVRGICFPERESK